MAALRAIQGSKATIKQPKKTKTIQQLAGALNKETKKVINRGHLQVVGPEYIHGPSGRGLKGYNHDSGMRGYGVKTISASGSIVD